MNDIWVCDSCRSINRMRDGQCYHCRAPRSQAMETPGLDLRANSAAAERSARSYVISWPLALISVVLLVAVAVLGLIVLKLQSDDYPRMRQAFLDAITSGSSSYQVSLTVQSVQAALLGTLRLGLVLLALLTFASWLALVTRNIPLLGGGTPSRSPVRVFLFTIIPLWQLFKVPGMIQDALYRVDPVAGGAFMVLAAWVGLVGSAFVNFLGSWAIESTAIQNLIRIAQSGAPDSAAFLKVFSDALDQLFWLGIIVEVMIAFGTIVLAGVMIRIESRCAARDAEIRGQMQATGAPTVPDGPSWSTPGAAAAPVGGAVAAASAASAAPSSAPSTADEPNWPASRPWPGASSSSSTASSDSPSSGPLPPPPPPDTPRPGG